MPNRARSEAMFDLFSYARRGPGRRDHLSPAQIEQIARTAAHTPEVMVKVLPKGATNLAAVSKHIDYVGRKGELEMETDDGRTLQGAEVGNKLLQDWDLDLDEYRRKSGLNAGLGKPPPRLVHKLVFSMPPGTAPEKVLKAVQIFCREEFALKHRYVLGLHTDEPHPHVHVVLKAASEQGQRLHIRKATLREWRVSFADHLRAVGVAANATPRVLRGVTTPRKPDAIHRAWMRGESTHVRLRAETVAKDLMSGSRRFEPAKTRLSATRSAVIRGWHAVSATLEDAGRPELAGAVRRFSQQMPLPRTEREWTAKRLLERLPTRSRPGRPDATTVGAGPARSLPGPELQPAR